MQRNSAVSALQKVYDECYLTCTTAVYFESQENEADALRSWRAALDTICHHNAYCVQASSHRPRSETERALQESLREMELQCRERVDLLETLRRSRSDGAAGGHRRTSHDDRRQQPDEERRPPPLPARPSGALSTATKAKAFPEPVPSPAFVPLAPANLPVPRASTSRSSSPEKAAGLRKTLRTSRGGKKPAATNRPPDVRTNSGPAASQAASQAWVAQFGPTADNLGQSIKAGSSSSVNSLRRHGSKGVPERVTSGASAVGEDAHARKLAGQQAPVPPRPTWTSPQVSPPPEGVFPKRPQQATASASNGPRRKSRSPPNITATTSPVEPVRKNISPPRPTAPVMTSTPVPYSVLPSLRSQDGVSRRPASTRPKAPTNTPKTGNEKADQVDEASASKPRRRSSRSSPPAPTKSAWEIQRDQLMKKLPKGVDEAAAKQIFNEIVVQGDEVHWDDVAGLDVAKNALKEAVVYPFLRPDLFMGLREPARGMLLFGPPGTGKTMLARAVATESKSTFFSISASSLTSKYLGESEKLVRALFQIAKALAPSIIFVDEIDSLLSTRSGSGEHESTRRIKTEFLIQWSDLQRAAAGREQSDKEREKGDASRVLVLAATNLPWSIDEAARRRFVRRQYIPLPEGHIRARQVRTLLGHQKQDLSSSEIDRLVELTEGFSGSDITALTKDAAMGPLRSLGEALLHMSMDDIRPIRFQDFEASLINIRPSVSKEGLQKFEEWAREFGERGG
ncbi:MAG: hypothetical protein M1825_004991 [Sarcosagium campestre]|nr:MAG: hypothetical protein M1825_004991 [Sarcosagium campestre]